MLIKLIKNSLIFAFFITAELVISTTSSQGIDISLSDNASLALKQLKSGFTATIHEQKKSTPASISQPLLNIFKHSDQIITLSNKFVAFNSVDAVTVIARIPSSKKPEGYCGSGHEDYLLFIAVQKNQLRLIDKALIQSCLHNISLESDNGSDDPSDAVIDGVFPVIANFKAISPPSYEVQELQARINGNKITVEQQGSQ